MHTFSGRRFYPLKPRAEDVCLEDIAHALSMICRFGGHCPMHYSVAQHSVLVSFEADHDDQLWGLLHDASEAYLGDMIRPIKHQLAMGAYRDAEAAVMACVCERFGLDPRMPLSVRNADRRVLATEARDVRELSGKMDFMPSPLRAKIIPWPAGLAKQQFLLRAAELGLRS